MKNSALLLTLGLLAVAAPITRAQPTDLPNAIVTLPQTPGAELSAAQVMGQVAKTYAGFKKYEGRGAYIFNGINEDKGQTKESVLVANTFISYTRGSYLNIIVDDGSSKFQASGGFSGDLSLKTTRAESLDIKPELRVFEDKKNLSKTDALIIALQPQAGGTGTMMLKALENFRYPPLFSTKDGVSLRPTETLGGVPCYIVERREADTNTVTTFWFEKSSFLLRRMTVEQGDHNPGPLGIKGKTYPRSHTVYASSTYVFTTEKAE